MAFMRTPEERERRARAFARVRRKRTREQASLTPEERLARADDLASLWEPPQATEDGFVLRGRPHSGNVRSTDEPIELWRAIRARLRGSPT
jgi:hypothetical protein